MRGNHNEGIQVFGSGRIEAGAVAAGRGATASTGGGPPDPGRQEIARRLAELLHQLDTAGPQLRNQAEVRESTQVVADELGKERPNKTTVTGVLTGIAGAVASVTGLATAANALLDAVTQFL